MKPKILLKARKMAQKAGFDDVNALGKWRGYDVAEAVFTDGAVHYIGYPQYILAKDGELRWCRDADESMAIMDAGIGDEREG